MNRPALFLFCFVALVAACGPAASQPATPQAFAHSTQMIVVVTPGWDAVQGWLERFERADPHESWRYVGEPIPIVVGSKGMGWGIGIIDAGYPGVRVESEPTKIEGGWQVSRWRFRPWYRIRLRSPAPTRDQAALSRPHSID